MLVLGQKDFQVPGHDGEAKVAVVETILLVLALLHEAGGDLGGDWRQQACCSCPTYMGDKAVTA